MTEMNARFKPGQNVPAFAKTLVAAGHFVKVVDVKTADGDYQVGHCGLGQRAFGVAEQDSAATTESAHSVERRINVIRPGAVARVVPGAAITHGDLIISDSTGRAIPLDAAVAALLDTGVVGSNNAIEWTAVEPGTGGNAITVAITNPGGTVAAEVVTVAGSAISVAARTSSGSITSTAAQIIAAIQAHGEASDLVSVANQSTSTGAGTVAAVGATHLASGTDPEGGGVALGQAMDDYDSDAAFAEVALF